MYREPVNLDVVVERTPPSIVAKYVKRILVVIVIVIVAMPVLAYVRGSNRTVHIVNGTAVEYDIEIDGRRITLPPFGRVPITLAEGEHVLRTYEPLGDVREETISLRSDGLLNRAVGKPGFVVNPDRAAIVYLHHIEYVANPNARHSRTPPPTDVRTGDVAHVWPKVEYAFRNTPERINMRRSAVRFVSHLDHLGEMAVDRAAKIVEDALGGEKSIEYLRHRFRFEPDDWRLLAELATRLNDDVEFISLLEPLLNRRPLFVEVHRFYQTAFDRAHPDRDLRDRYEAMAAAAPEDGRAVYLKARLLDQPREAERLMLRAAELGEPSGSALHAVVIRRMSSGRFEEAAETAWQLVEGNPHDLHYQWHQAEALRAAGRHEHALPILSYLITKEPWNTNHRLEYVDALLSLGRDDEAQRAIDRFIEHIRENVAPHNQRSWMAYIQGAWKYVRGDETGAIEELRLDPGEFSQLLVALADRDFDMASQLAASLDGPRRSWFVSIVAIAAHHAGEKEHSQAAVHHVAERLSRGDRYERRYAAWLRGEDSPTRDDLLELPMHTRDRLVMLTLIGLLEPDLREWCFEQARALNFDRMFPHLLVRSVVGE